MSKFTREEVQQAFRGVVVEPFARVGANFALLVGDTAVKATTVSRMDESAYDQLDEVYGYEVWFVFQIGEQYFKYFGSWSSHEGYDWAGGQVREVKPVEVVKTEFRPV